MKNQQTKNRVACIALCAAMLGAAPGCKVFDESLLTEGRAGVPPQPPMDTTSPTDAETRVFALKDVYINQTEGNAPTIGLDLDDVLTTDSESGSCQPQAGGTTIIDGPGGIDNALGEGLLSTVGVFLPCLEDNIALAMGRGNGTILLWLRGWNGQPNDAQVSVAVTSAVDGTSEDPAKLRFQVEGSEDVNELFYVEGQEPDGGVPDGGAVPAPAPGWAGADTWYFDPDDFGTRQQTVMLPNDGGTNTVSVPDPSRPLREVQSAYVSSGRLVMILPDDFEFALIEVNGSLDVKISGGIFLGDLDDGGQNITQGLLAGRFATSDLIDATPRIGICEETFGTLIDEQIPRLADVQVLTDGNPSTPCDAVSLGIPFKGMAGAFGGFAPSPLDRPEPCDPESPNQPLIPPLMDRCCPSVAFDPDMCIIGNPDHDLKKEWFSELPDAIILPVTEPEF